MTLLQQLFANPGFSSGSTNNYQLLLLISKNIFFHQLLWADGMLFPNLHKALLVVRHGITLAKKFIVFSNFTYSNLANIYKQLKLKSHEN